MTSKDAMKLKQFLQHLPQTDRYILLLHYADGLTAAEIALVLDLPLSKVQSRFEALRLQAGAMIGAPSALAAPAPLAAEAAGLAVTA
jgi:DNA-directed RNA polymerase specialized sigma24 family protein